MFYFLEVDERKNDEQIWWFHAYQVSQNEAWKEVNDKWARKFPANQFLSDINFYLKKQINLLRKIKLLSFLRSV